MPQPRGEGVPAREVVGANAGRCVIGDGRGLGGQEVVHLGLDRARSLADRGGCAGGVLRRRTPEEHARPIVKVAVANNSTIRRAA